MIYYATLVSKSQKFPPYLTTFLRKHNESEQNIILILLPRLFLTCRLITITAERDNPAARLVDEEKTTHALLFLVIICAMLCMFDTRLLDISMLLPLTSALIRI